MPCQELQVCKLLGIPAKTDADGFLAEQGTEPTAEVLVLIGEPVLQPGATGR